MKGNRWGEENHVWKLNINISHNQTAHVTSGYNEHHYYYKSGTSSNIYSRLTYPLFKIEIFKFELKLK